MLWSGDHRPCDTDPGTGGALPSSSKDWIECFFFKDFIYLFIFRERRREGEKHRYVRDTAIGYPQTQACALTGSQTMTEGLQAGTESTKTTPARVNWVKF